MAAELISSEHSNSRSNGVQFLLAARRAVLAASARIRKVRQVPDTEKIASTMERYNPDKTWNRTDDNW
jgi:hypothetical protein